MKKWSIILASATFVLGLILTFSGIMAGAADKPTVRSSGQPCLHGLPIWMAIEKKWPEKMPINLTYTLFPSGAPQVEAMAANQWDCGAMGTVPSLMAGLRYGAYLIGISNEEAETNDLWVRPDSPLLKTKGHNKAFPEIYGTPSDWKGKTILVTTVSTGHYALSATLKALGLKDNDVKIVNIEQGQALTAFNAGQGDIVQLWAPFDYIGESKGWIKVSSGRRAGVAIPGGIVVRKEFADKHPELVVDWLDAYMRGVDEMRTDHAGSAKWLAKYYKDYCGLKLTDEAIQQEFKLRPLFSVDQEVELMTNPDKVKKWMTNIAQFFVDQGRMSKEEMASYVKANCYIEPKFMQMLAKKRKAQ